MKSSENYLRFESGVMVTSPEMFYLAKEALERCRKNKDFAIDSITAVILSVATLEGFINELIQFAVILCEIHNLREAVRRYSIKEKYSCALKILSGGKFNFRNNKLWDSFKYLLKLRNELVHLKSEKIIIAMKNEGKTPEYFIKALVDKRTRETKKSMTKKEIENLSRNIIWLGQAVEKYNYPGDLDGLLENLKKLKILREDAENYLKNKEHHWIHLICTDRLAYWACKTTADIINEIFCSSGEGKIRKMLDESYGDCFKFE